MLGHKFCVAGNVMEVKGKWCVGERKNLGGRLLVHPESHANKKKLIEQFQHASHVLRHLLNDPSCNPSIDQIVTVLIFSIKVIIWKV